MSEVRKINFPIALIFGTHIKFLDLLFIDILTIVLLALLLLSPTTLLSLAINSFGAKFNNLINFNNAISSVAILLKPWMKY